MCCSDPPPPPDLGPAAEASMEVARISQQTAQDQLAWAREQDTMNRDVLNQVLDIQLPAMQDQFANAREDRQRYEDVFRPMEDQFVREAQEFDSPERRAEERGRAVAGVNQQFDAQRQNALSRLESYGIDPSQTRNQAMDVGVRTAQAAAAAGASNQAENRVEDTGRALRSDAINLGRGALSNVASSYGQSVAAGQGAVTGANQTTGTSTGAIQSSLGFGNQALSGFGQGANILSQGYGNQMSQYNAQNANTAGMLQGVGGIIGMGLGLNDGGQPLEGDYIPAGEGQAIPQDPRGTVYGPGDGSGIDDQIPAQLSQGEYVIPADVVRIKGEEFFDKLLEKYHTPAAEQRQEMRAA